MSLPGRQKKRIPAACQMIPEGRRTGIAGEQKGSHLLGEFRRQGEAPGIVGIEDNGLAGGVEHLALDCRHVVDCFDSVHVDLLARDIEERGDIAIIEIHAGLDEPAARRLEHGRGRVAQHDRCAIHAREIAVRHIFLAILTDSVVTLPTVWPAHERMLASIKVVVVPNVPVTIAVGMRPSSPSGKNP